MIGVREEHLVEALVGADPTGVGHRSLFRCEGAPGPFWSGLPLV